MAKSQDLTIIPPIEQSKASLSFQTNFMVTSSSITNNFFNAYNNGDFITNELKNDVIESLDDKNLLGTMNNQKLSYFFTLDSTYLGKRNGMFVSVENHNLTEIRFTDTFFKLFFNGNKEYEGKSANLDKMRFNSLSYQQLKIGFFTTKKNTSGNSIIGGAFAFNKGQNHLFVDFNNASFYTAQYGEYIDLEVDSKISMSDTSANDLLAFNGYGASFDLFYKYKSANNHSFSVEVSNIGFIRWKNESFISTLDTTFHHKGWYVEDLFDFNSLIFQERLNDSLIDNFIYKRDEKGYISMIPLSIKLTYIRNIIPEKFDIEFTLHHLFFTAYKPYFLVQPKLHVTRTLKLGASVSYGGYGNMNAGLEMVLSFQNKFYLKTGSRIINGLAFPALSSGLNYFIQFDKFF